MNMLEFATGFLQLTIVLLFVLFVTRSVRSRSPDLAAKIGTLGLMLGCLVVALTLFNVPRIIDKKVGSPSSVSVSPIGQVPATNLDEQHVSPHRPTLTLSLRQWLVRLADQDVMLATGGQGRVDWWLLCGCMLAIVLVSPLLTGVLATVQMHHRSLPISEETQQYLCSLGLTENVALHVSNMIAVPCVTLYGGRTIYLPNEWNEWPRDELSAALAHETAHLNRRDARQRMIVQFACLVQWFHPIAWLLGRSIMLSQEMAADRQAASAASENYALGLLKIALRADELLQCEAHRSLKNWFTRPGMVSVSSSHLIRRIKMLSQQTEGSVSSFCARLSQIAVVAVFAASACWNLHAEPPGGQKPGNEPDARIARLPESEVVGKLFSYPRLAPWDHVPLNNNGYAAIRVRHVLQHPSLAFANAFVEPLIDEGWRKVSSDQSANERVALGLELSNVNDAIASVHLDFENKPPDELDDSDKSGDFTLGADGLVLHFIEPIVHDDVIDAIDVDRVVSVGEQIGMQSESSGGMTTIQIIRGVLDSVFTDGAITHELSIQPGETEVTKEQSAQLKRAWTEVDGGMLTLCSALPNTIGYVDNEADELTDQVLSQATTIGMGIDIGRTGVPDWSRERLHIQLAFLPEDGVELDQLVETICRAISVWTDETRKVIEDENDRVEAEKILQVLETSQVFRSPTGESAMLTIEVPIESFGALGVF